MSNCLQESLDKVPKRGRRPGPVCSELYNEEGGLPHTPSLAHSKARTDCGGLRMVRRYELL